MVPRNVAGLAKPPRVRRVEVRALSPIEATGILHAVHGDRLGPVVTFALATGVRQGEALAGRAARRGYRAHTPYPSASVWSFGRTGRAEDGPQPQNADPAVECRRHAERASVPTEERATASRCSLAWRRATGRSGRLCVHYVDRDTDDRLGRDTSLPTAPSSRWTAAYAVFHDLRHGAASLLLAQGVSPRVIQDMLGHSTITTTMSVYAHVIPELQRDAAARMDAILSPKGSATG